VRATQSNQAQLKSIGDVVKALQAAFPDVSHSSLRFLEREGLARSTRTEGGHRLYAPADIDRIIRIKRWQAERLTLDQIRERLAELDRLPAAESLAAEFVDDAVSGDLAAAGEVIARADQVGLPLATLFTEVLTPALREIGDRWEQGDVPVAREKEVSELSRELIAELTRRHAVPERQNGVVVAACVEGEKHELGLRMVVGLLRARGIRVSFLGADVATRFLLEAVAMRSPAVVLLSVKQTSARDALEEALAALRDLDDPFEVIVGGELSAIEAAMIERYGARIVPNDDPAEALRLVEEALAQRPTVRAG